MKTPSLSFIAFLAVFASFAMSANKSSSDSAIVPNAQPQKTQETELSFDLEEDNDLLTKDYTKSQELDKVLQRFLDAEVERINRTKKKPQVFEDEEVKVVTDGEDDEDQINELSELESSAFVSGDLKKEKEEKPPQKTKNSKKSIIPEKKGSLKKKNITIPGDVKYNQSKPIVTASSEPRKKLNRIKNLNIKVSDEPEIPTFNRGIQREYDDKKSSPGNKKKRSGDYDSEEKGFTTNHWDDSDQQNDKDSDDMGREDAYTPSGKSKEDPEDDTIALEKELQFMSGREYMVGDSQPEPSSNEESKENKSDDDIKKEIAIAVGLGVIAAVAIIGIAFVLYFVKRTENKIMMYLY